MSAEVRARLPPEQLKELLKRSLQVQLAELSPEQRLLLQRRIIQQRFKTNPTTTATGNVPITPAIGKTSRSQSLDSSTALTATNTTVAPRRSNSLRHKVLGPPTSSSAASTGFDGSIADPNGHACIDCGKTYKHLNCLQKHRWEHHEAWDLTRTCCQNKHQQAQLLEAAQMLLDIQQAKRSRVSAITSASSDGSASEDDVVMASGEEQETLQTAPEDADEESGEERQRKRMRLLEDQFEEHVVLSQ